MASSNGSEDRDVLFEQNKNKQYLTETMALPLQYLVIVYHPIKDYLLWPH